MKKILFVLDSLNSGGAEKSLISLLTMFDYKKYKVDLLLFSPNGLYFSLLPNEVNLLDVPEIYKKKKSRIIDLIRNRNFKVLYSRIGASISIRNPLIKKRLHTAQINWKWTKNYLNYQEINYDVAIAYSQGTPTYYVAEKVKAKKKFCWINTDYKNALYNKFFDERYYQNYNNIIAVSELNKKVFIEEIPSAKKKTKVIYDIISTNLIRSLSQEGGGFKENFSGIRILTIGRLVEEKGFDLAIEACHLLKIHGFNIKWYVIGEGILKERLKQKVLKLGLVDTFVFLGVYHNPYVFIKQCELYVQPSKFEGFGLAIAEAKVLGKPIVATNFNVVHNQIKNKVNGLIVNMDSNSIYIGIKNIIEDSNLRNKIVQNLYKENVGTELEIEKLYNLIE